jgi:hypothetical protein
MKKKLVIFIVLIALVSSLLFTSCTFIQENEERVANTVLAEVTYDYEGNDYFPEQTLSLTVTRSELVSYVNYVVYLYSNYNMDYDSEDVFDSSLDSLITQKYQILEGMAYLMNNCSEERRLALYYNTDEYKEIYGTTIIPEGLLTISERLYAISTTNDSFETTIEGYVTDYEDGVRELAISTAKESLTAHYSAGYTVADDDDGGIAICYLNDDGETYTEGLYQTEFSTDNETSVDYTQIYMKLTLIKDGSDDYIVYMPISSDDLITSDDSDDVSDNSHITNKLATIGYDEPVTTTEEVTDDDTGEVTTEEVTSYETHTASESYKTITPRTTVTTEEEDDELNEDYRYLATFDMTDTDQAAFYEDGQIFEISPDGLDDANEDAYRQFREAKKSELIGFTTDEDPYNGLSYYYKSSFESALLTAVQYELTDTTLTTTPVTEDQLVSQYTILAQKQKEEYDILSYQEQVDKFATLIGTDLTSCYYIPLEALQNTTYTYTDSLGVEQTRAYATLNDDGTYTIDMFYITHILFKYDDDVSTIIDRYIANLTDDDEIKEAKLNFILSIGLLNTNQSNEDYADNGGDSLSDSYYVILDDDGTPVLLDEDGNTLSIEDQFLEVNVKEIYTSLIDELATATTDADRLTIFKKYMTWYNDDSGSMSSELGYFIGMGDIEDSYDGDDFPDTAKEIYIDLIEDGVISDYTGVAFTSYGLHVETISFMPFYQVNLTELSTGLWVLGLDNDMDLTGSTMRDTLQTSIEDSIESNTYSDWSSAITDEIAEEHCVRNTSKINKLSDDLGITE